MPATTQTKKIIIKVDAPGVKAAVDSIARGMGSLNRNTKSLAGNMGFLSNAFRSWIGFLGVRELVKMSDNMQNLSNRLNLVTGSVEGASVAMAGIAGIADRTFLSMANVGQTFTRFSNALKIVGASTAEVLTLTEVLSNSFRVSGATSEESTNGILQLSQAFSKGKLDGDEFRSVMEANVILAQALKKEYGADLYKKAKDGAIGITEVLKVLAKNQEAINEGAKKLSPTFENTLAKSMNTVAISIGNLNKGYDLSGKFAIGMGFIVRNLAEIFTVLAGTMVLIYANRIPALITAVNNLRVAFITFSANNPILLTLTLIATAGALIYENWNKISPVVNRVKASLKELYAEQIEAELKLRVARGGAGADLARTQLEKLQKDLATARELAKGLQGTEVSGRVEESPAQKMARDLETLIAKMGPAAVKAKTLKGELSDLNKAYLSGSITIEKYNEKLIAFDLRKATRQFSEGKEDIFKFNKQIESIQLAELSRELNVGAISLEEFNRFAATNRLYVLNAELRAGKIGLEEYNRELTKLDDKVRPGAAFYTGISDFISSVGTLSEGIARTTSQAFDHLSDTLTDFVKTGKFQFADFTRQILDDLTAMLVRAAIVRPIAQGILGAFGGIDFGSSASAGLGASANTQAAFAGSAANGGLMTPHGFAPLNKYANGGVATSPQVALFGEGRTPEAYVPLPDGRNIPVKLDGGGSGVSVVQNITVNTDGSSMSSEKTAGQGAKQLANAIRQGALDVILQQQRPGGALA